MGSTGNPRWGGTHRFLSSIFSGVQCAADHHRPRLLFVGLSLVVPLPAGYLVAMVVCEANEGASQATCKRNSATYHHSYYPLPQTAHPTDATSMYRKRRSIALLLQDLVDFLIDYIKEKRDRWSAHDNDEGTEFGASLAVEVVQTLRGGDRSNVGPGETPDIEPEWLKLKWGIAIAARALDVCSASGNSYGGDMVRKRRWRYRFESVMLLLILVKATENALLVASFVHAGKSGREVNVESKIFRTGH